MMAGDRKILLLNHSRTGLIFPSSKEAKSARQKQAQRRFDVTYCVLTKFHKTSLQIVCATRNA